MEDKIFGESGSQIVIEEFLTGPEVSVLSFTDGNVVIPMVSSMDHKRASATATPAPTPAAWAPSPPTPITPTRSPRRCMETIFLPTMHAMNAEGRTFKGCLYFGLMLTRRRSQGH